MGYPKKVSIEFSNTELSMLNEAVNCLLVDYLHNGAWLKSEIKILRSILDKIQKWKES